MTIKQNGGIFGRNPTFNDVTVDGTLTASTVGLDGAVTVNESGASVDFRVEGNTDTHLIFTDGANDRVGVGTDNTQLFNAVGGNSKLVVTGDNSETNVAGNRNASITIANADGTANNTAGLHFAREDDDGAPNYAGASIVAQFPQAQVSGQYPQGQLVFLTSSVQNASPSEKLRILAGGGITFNGDTAEANALDDYEEGTWTPTWEGNTTPGTITASTLVATYTKVGRIVHVQVYAIFNVAVAGSGYLKVTLPFSKASNTMFCGPVNTYNIDLPAGAVDSTVVPTSSVPSNNIALFSVSTDNGATGLIDASGISTSDEILFAFSYIAA